MTFVSFASSFTPSPLRRRRARGFSLVEMMVALLIGLMLTLVMASALVLGESHKRTTGATTDMDQSGAYVASMMDILLRNAGSGLMQSTAPVSAGLLGCNLNAGGVLPASNLPAPFERFLGGHPASLGVAPVLIAKNQSSDGSSDVLVIMSGSGAAGGIPRPLSKIPGDATTLNLTNTVGINSGDLVLLSAPGNPACIIEPVSAVAPVTLTLGGALYANPNNLAGMLSVSGAYATPLGSLSSGDVQFQLLGVGNNDTLYGYDLLSATTQALASNVLALHALYGIDTAGDGKLHVWVDPGTSSGYGIDAMMGNQGKLQQIVAIRVALVLKSSLYEKEEINAAAPTWFGNGLNPVGVTSNGITAQHLEGADFDPHYRYRVVEFVVPVRNALLSLS